MERTPRLLAGQPARRPFIQILAGMAFWLRDKAKAGAAVFL
jgi:hypothetical protein